MIVGDHLRFETSACFNCFQFGANLKPMKLRWSAITITLCLLDSNDFLVISFQLLEKLGQFEWPHFPSSGRGGGGGERGGTRRRCGLYANEGTWCNSPDKMFRLCLDFWSRALRAVVIRSDTVMSFLPLLKCLEKYRLRNEFSVRTPTWSKTNNKTKQELCWRYCELHFSHVFGHF